MAQYTLTLNSEADYKIIRKLLKAFDGATIKRKKSSRLEQAFKEVENGEVKGPFNSVEELMNDLLN